MKKQLLQMALGTALFAGFTNPTKAQETQIKFFGQPELQNIQTSTQGKWVPDATSPTGVSFNTTKHDTSKTAFNQGNYVLFVTSQLSERISVLSENLASLVGTTPTFDVKRLLIRYYIKDYFSLRVGKMFNPIGYWNNQYNFGLVLQPTIARPSIILPAAEGGVLQINDVGLQVEGDNISKARLFYRLFIHNGTNSVGFSDKGDNKFAYTGALGIEPIDGLKILVSGMYDNFYKSATNPAGYAPPKNGNLLLSNVAVAFMNPEKKFEAIAELYMQTNTYDSIGKRSSYGYFGYAGYKVTNKFIPYVSYMYAQAGTTTQSDIYYVGQNGVLYNATTFSLGLRYKVSANFVCKLEYNYRSAKETFQNGEFAALPKVLNLGDKINTQIDQGFHLQFAYSF